MRQRRVKKARSGMKWRYDRENDGGRTEDERMEGSEEKWRAAGGMKQKRVKEEDRKKTLG